MNNQRPPRRSTESGARALACCVLALLCAAACGAARAQVRAPELKKQQGAEQKAARKDSDDDEDDGREEVFAPPTTDPGAILRKARFVLVRSDSVFISGREVEDSLRKRKEFQAWRMVVTRDEAQADLVIEITRKPLTRRFTFTVIDPHTSEVVASGKTRSVIFGKKIANKVAEKFANRVKVYRPYPPA
jgi:hypothetical protein